MEALKRTRGPRRLLRLLIYDHHREDDGECFILLVHWFLKKLAKHDPPQHVYIHVLLPQNVLLV